MQQLTTKNKCNYFVLSVSSGRKSLFVDNDDYNHFLDGVNNTFNDFDKASVAAYCLRRTSIEILYLLNSGVDLNEEINRLFSDYKNYFYKKHHLGLSRFIAKLDNKRVKESELVAVSKKIHTNPKKWCHYEKSSIMAYLYGDEQIEIDKSSISSRFLTAIDYYNYLKQQP